jgi:hypothetical protein
MAGKNASVRVVCCVLLSVFACTRPGHGQDSIRIISPSTGDLVAEGRTLKISVSADPAVHNVAVITEDPIPFPKPIGGNQFEVVLPKTIPPGRYSVTAVGVLSELVASQSVAIQVERDDPATSVDSPPLIAFTAKGDKMPLSVIAHFEDGSKLDVTHSIKTTFEPKDRSIVKVDENAEAVALAPGETAIVIGYGSQYSATIILGPNTVLGGRIINTQGAQVGPNPSLQESVGTVSSGAASALHNGIEIGSILGRITPGGHIRIEGSKFGSEQGSGYVTVAGTPAQVVLWTTQEITIIVPNFKVSGSVAKISVHRDNDSEDFPVILPANPSQQK